MGNFKVALKRFFGNKNTVTIICVILVVAILGIAYNLRIKSETNPVQVPYAKQNIQPRTKVTDDMIGYVEIPSSMVTENTVTSSSLVVGKYVNYNTVVPSGSVFYKSVLVEYKDMPDSAFSDIPDGYTVVSLPADLDSTYGNSIFPGNYIDLYMKATNDSGKVILGKLIESIEVLDVRDSSGRHVFENTEENRTPAYLLFAVPEQMHLLLRKASYLSGVQIIPIPRNSEYSKKPGKTNISSKYLQNYINSKTISVPDVALPSLSEDDEEEEDVDESEEDIEEFEEE